MSFLILAKSLMTLRVLAAVQRWVWTQSRVTMHNMPQEYVLARRHRHVHVSGLAIILGIPERQREPRHS